MKGRKGEGHGPTGRGRSKSKSLKQGRVSSAHRYEASGVARTARRSVEEDKTEKMTETRGLCKQKQVQSEARDGQLLADRSVLLLARPSIRPSVCGAKPRSGDGGCRWRLSHLVGWGKLSLQNISIRKGGSLCLGLSPCSDRVHKCGQALGTGAVSMCADNVGYHSCHFAGPGTPSLPTLPLETTAIRPLSLFPQNVSGVAWQVFAGRQGRGTPARWGRTGCRHQVLLPPLGNLKAPLPALARGSASWVRLGWMPEEKVL